MKIFWDTNIAIDLLSPKRKSHEIASKLMSYHVKNNEQITINSLTLANSSYILTSIYKYKDTPKRLVYLNSISTVCKMDKHQADLALASEWDDFEDALQYQSAIAYGCDLIISRDKRGFKNSVIPVLTPEQFLEEQNNAT